MGQPKAYAFPPPHPSAKWVPRRQEKVLLEPGGLSNLVLEVKGLQLSRPTPVLTTTLPVADMCRQKLNLTLNRDWIFFRENVTKVLENK